MNSLVVSAVDGGPSPVNSDYCEVFISVLDVNEFTPTFPTRFFFTETVPENQPVGTFVFTAKASDKDAGQFGVVRYRMVPTSTADVGAFVINEVTGDVTTGLVFNASATYLSFQYRITATDSGGLNSTVGAIVKVCVLLHLCSSVCSLFLLLIYTCVSEHWLELHDIYNAGESRRYFAFSI